MPPPLNTHCASHIKYLTTCSHQYHESNIALVTKRQFTNNKQKSVAQTSCKCNKYKTYARKKLNLRYHGCFSFEAQTIGI